MLICHLYDCTCTHHRLLSCMKKGMNKKAKSLLQSIENSQDLADSSGLTLLHYSVQYYNLEMVQILVDQGHNINAQDYTGVTALMLAVKNKDVEMIEVLLKNNADIYLADEKKVSSLYLAVNYYWSKFVFMDPNGRLLMEMFFEKINEDFSMDNHKITQLLRKSNILVKLATVVFGNVQLTTLMLQNGYKVDYRAPKLNYMTALHCAIGFGKIDNCKLLIEHGANLLETDRFGYSALSNYTKRMQLLDEDSEMLKYFLKWLGSASLSNLKKREELESLLNRGKKKTVRTVLQSDVYMAVCYKNIGYLLHVLIYNMNVDVLDLFEELNIKFDVNKFDLCGSTALMVAAQSGCLRKVEFLLNHGADVNVKTANGRSALFSAVTKGYSNFLDLEEDVAKIVELLLERGADAQIVTDNGCSIINIISHGSERLLTKVILAHLAMLRALDESLLTDFIRNNIKKYSQVQTQFDLYTQQLEEMKRLKVYDSVTLFKLLTERNVKIVTYVRNKELVSAFKSIMESKPQLEPYYINTLQKRVECSIHKVELEERAAPAFGLLSKLSSDAYHNIVYKIFSHLNHQDLLNICEAGNTLYMTN